MAIDAELLALLACPFEHHAPLRAQGTDALVCTECGSSFPIRDGIPVLLPSAAVRPAPGQPSV